MGGIVRKLLEGLPSQELSRSLAFRGLGVQKTHELARILDLPRRKLDFKNIPDLTPAFALPGGALTLRPVQSAALLEAERAGGLMGAIGVGWGKTLTALLLPWAFECPSAVYLVPPELKKQLIERDIPYYSQHFKLPPIHILAYSELSSPKGFDALEKLAPKLIIADEAHRLKRKESARTKRFLHYMKQNQDCRFCALSGSITTRSILDYAHLARLALREGAPVPLEWPILSEWAQALDAIGSHEAPLAPGALILLCEGEETPREGYQRRLKETPGWVATEEAAFDGSLYIRARSPELPPEIKDALAELRRTWAIAGIELEDGTALTRVARQIACGFYYRWLWPNKMVDRAWLEARNGWSRWVREYLSRRSRPGIDSPLLLWNAVTDGRIKDPDGVALQAAWAAEKHKPEPAIEAVWLSDYLIDDALAWIKSEASGVLWCAHTALAERLSIVSGRPLFGEGTDAGKTNPKSDPFIICTTRSQGEGKNLQAWSKNYMASPLSSGSSWEQLLGRTHRPGQEKDEVWVDCVLQTPENKKALQTATEQAKYIQQTTGALQKLLSATLIGVTT